MRLWTLFALAAAIASAADMPSGESLLQRYIDRSGGTAAYNKAQSMTMTGTVEMAAQNIKGTVEIYEDREKSYTAMEFAGIGKIEEGFDGDTAWQNSALQGPRIMDGDERLSAKRAARLLSFTTWREVYSDAVTMGSVDIDGKPAWKVEMKAKEGKPETFYFDRDSGLLVRIAAVFATAMGEISTESTMSDFRPVDGILTPFALTQSALGQNIAMHFTKIAYNAPIPKDRFDLPAPIKALKH